MFFNSHPHKEDDNIITVGVMLIGVFNSHPHKEDDIDRWFRNLSDFYFSTHILTRRMTALRRKVQAYPSFSTHILTRRMTSYYSSVFCSWNFSTHILTRRMTATKQPVSNSLSFFNSHPHKEDDSLFAWPVLPELFFNSHPHKEDDKPLAEATQKRIAFQLTSSQGG